MFKKGLLLVLLLLSQIALTLVFWFSVGNQQLLTFNLAKLKFQVGYPTGWHVHRFSHTSWRFSEAKSTKWLHGPGVPYPPYSWVDVWQLPYSKTCMDMPDTREEYEARPIGAEDDKESIFRSKIVCKNATAIEGAYWDAKDQGTLDRIIGSFHISP